MLTMPSVDVGRTIPSEGSHKLPDFEPDQYSDLYLRWFLRFVVHTTGEHTMQ